MSTPTPPNMDMSPKDLLDKNGNYVLQAGAMYDLLKYVWTGCLLPINAAGYQERLQLSTDTMVKLEDVLQNLFRAYATTQSHCEPFKDTTYPSIVAIADDVYNYAQNAGGTESDSYYAQIFQNIRSLATAAPSDQASIKQTINSLVDIQVQSIAAIQTKAQTVLDDLTTFENQCMEDQTALKSCNKAVLDRLSTEVGNLNDLVADLASNRRILQADEAAYEKDKIIAFTTLTYCWIPFIGPIVAGIVAGVFGSAAAKLAKAIDGVKDDITADTTKIADEKRLIADLTCIDENLDTLLNDIGVAITIIQLMMGAWSGISGDLTSLKDMVNTNVRGANAAIAQIVDAKLVEKWNDLAASVDKYRQAAFITPIQQVTLDDVSKQLHENATVNK